jgi:S-DNA-T family DNA segregation ATPase FtsK/SpoIIIE
LRAADDETNSSNQYVHSSHTDFCTKHSHQSPFDWNDDQIFDELLLLFQIAKQLRIYTPFIQESLKQNLKVMILF